MRLTSTLRRTMSAYTTISTPNAPGAIGPYSQAIKTDLGLVFCSGCIPLNPQSMKVRPPSCRVSASS